VPQFPEDYKGAPAEDFTEPEPEPVPQFPEEYAGSPVFTVEPAPPVPQFPEEYAGAPVFTEEPPPPPPPVPQFPEKYASSPVFTVEPPPPPPAFPQEHTAAPLYQYEESDDYIEPLVLGLDMDLFTFMNKEAGDSTLDLAELETAMLNPMFWAVADLNDINLKRTLNSKDDAARLMATIEEFLEKLDLARATTSESPGSISMTEFLQGMLKLKEKELTVADPPPTALTALNRTVAMKLGFLAEFRPPGCPDVRVNLEAGTLDILRPVTFEASKLEFKRGGDSAAILDQVGMALVIIREVCTKQGVPQAQFEVQGHTNDKPDARDSPAQMKLSEGRASTCIKHLTDADKSDIMRAETSSLVAKGFGGVVRKFEEPNDVSLNERVEFVLSNGAEINQAANAAGAGEAN